MFADRSELQSDRFVALVAAALLLCWFAAHLRAQWLWIEAARIPLANDQAFFIQVLDNLAYLRGSSASILGFGSFFENHFTPLYYALAPLYKLLTLVFEIPLASYVLGDLFLLAFFCGIFSLSQRVFGIRGAWLLAGALLIIQCSPVNFLFRFGFRDSALALLPIVGLIFAFEKRNPRLFILWSIPLLLTREDVGLALFGFAILGVFRPGWFWKLFPWLGIIVFLFLTGVFFPHMVGVSGFQAIDRYSHLGQSIHEILLSPLWRPAAFWGSLFQEGNWRYLVQLLAGFLWLPLLRPRWLLPAIPYLFVLFLNRPHAESANLIWLPYSFAILPFCAAASLDALRYVQRRFNGSRLSFLAPVLPVLSLLYGTAFTGMALAPANGFSMIDSIRQARALLPDGAAVQTTMGLAPYVADRKGLRPFVPGDDFRTDEYVLLPTSSAAPDYWFQMGSLQSYRERLQTMARDGAGPHQLPLLYADGFVALWGPASATAAVAELQLPATISVEAEYTTSQNLFHRENQRDGDRIVRVISGRQLPGLRKRERGFQLMAGEFRSDGVNRIRILARPAAFETCSVDERPAFVALGVQTGAQVMEPWPTASASVYQTFEFTYELPRGESHLIGIQSNGCGVLYVDRFEIVPP